MKKYQITKRFTEGCLRGIRIVEETDIEFRVGQKVEKPCAGSPYIVEKVCESHFNGEVCEIYIN